jgi:hypothetical protein
MDGLLGKGILSNRFFWEYSINCVYTENTILYSVDFHASAFSVSNAFSLAGLRDTQTFERSP